MPECAKRPRHVERKDKSARATRWRKIASAIWARAHDP
jgi:hypothetical protein